MLASEQNIPYWGRMSLADEPSLLTVQLAKGVVVTAPAMNGYKFAIQTPTLTGTNQPLSSANSSGVSEKQVIGNTGISTAAAICIGSGGVLCVFGLIAGLIMIWILRRRRRLQGGVVARKRVIEKRGKPDDDFALKQTAEPLSSLCGVLSVERCEMSTVAEARELAGERSPIELEGRRLSQSREAPGDDGAELGDRGINCL